MPTTTTTATTNQYDSGSMNAYNAFSGTINGQLRDLVNNPFGNSHFQNTLAMMQRNAGQLASRNNSNALSNLRTGGGVLSNSPGFLAGLLNRNQIGNNVMQGNAFNSAVTNALQSKNVALASMQAYQPLQTGQTSQQSTGGLGTWLTPLLSAGLNMAMPGLGSMMGGGSFSGGYQGGGGGGMAAPRMGPAPASGSMGGNPWAAPWGGYSNGGLA